MRHHVIHYRHLTTLSNASSDEHARLNDQAAGFTELMKGKIVHAPLKSPAKILDVGCGTGIVTRHLASIYSSATVYGVDLSPVPPTNASDAIPSTPPNVEYIIGDIRKLAQEDERLKAGNFDCIFQRLLVCGMTHWPSYISQMAALLRPGGGWLEIHDYAEISYNAHESHRVISADWKWLQTMHRGAAQLDLDLEIGLHAEKYMREAGLVDVTVQKYMVPFGTWLADEKPETRKIGVNHDRDLGRAFSESILPGVTRKLGLTESEIDELKDECRRCLKGEEGHYWWFYVTTGRKE